MAEYLLSYWDFSIRLTYNIADRTVFNYVYCRVGSIHFPFIFKFKFKLFNFKKTKFKFIDFEKTKFKLIDFEKNKFKFIPKFIIGFAKIDFKCTFTLIGLT